jgi:adenine phosphoribosyltransferase
MTDHADLKALVRTIANFPKPGVQFRDVTTLLLNRVGLCRAVEALAETVDGPVDLVAAIEARGFAIGGALAVKLGAGLLLIRKDGKLPGATIAEDYALEYGTDRLAMHVDACAPGARVLIVDDLLATGGTALAAARLVKRAGGQLIGARFIIDLPELGGAQALADAGIDAASLFAFEGH